MRVDTAVFWTIWIVAIMGGVAIIIAAMIRRYKIIELKHKERMALIERGLVPPAEADSASPFAPVRFHDHRSVTGRRMLSGGIAVMGLGFGLMVLMGIAADSPEAALGVGGAIVVVGLSFVVIALVQGERPQSPLSGAPPFSVPPSPPPAPRPPDRES